MNVFIICCHYVAWMALKTLGLEYDECSDYMLLFYVCSPSSSVCGVDTGATYSSTWK